VRYSVIHMVATSGIVTAAGSPAAVSSAGLSPTSNHPSPSTTWSNHESQYSFVAATMAAGSPTAVRSVGASSSRHSISSTIRSYLESTSSLASSSRSSRWSTSAIRETIPDLEEDNDELRNKPAMGETEASDMVTQTSGSDHLRVPGLRLKTSFQSISTIKSEVSGAGSWDKASEAYSPNTDIGYEDDSGSRDVLAKMSLHDSRSFELVKHTDIRSPILDTIIVQPGFRESDPLCALAKVPELLESVLGYLIPSDITNLQLV